MDRINKTGRSLIEYKREYSKHYSLIVDDSLIMVLDTLLDKKVLNQEIFDLIINDSYSLDDFEALISNKREYVKSDRELLLEFEKVREIVNESLRNIDFTDFIETESNLDIGKISVLRQYTIDKEFFKLYFGLTDEEIPQIMKKKGFAEKFAVLRLTKIFKEIYAEMRPENDFSQSFSRVYYNTDVDGFSVDYKYHLNADYITTENIDNKTKKIKDTDKVVERKFIKKTGLSFYNIKTNENGKKENNEDLNVSKNSPNNKFKDINITNEEKESIKKQINNEIKTEENKAQIEKMETVKETVSNKQEQKQEAKQEIKQEQETKQEKKQENKNKQEQNKNNNQQQEKQNNFKENKQQKNEKFEKKKQENKQEEVVDYLKDEDDSPMEVLEEISNMEVSVEEVDIDDMDISVDVDVDEGDIVIDFDEIDDSEGDSFQDFSEDDL